MSNPRTAPDGRTAAVWAAITGLLALVVAALVRMDVLTSLDTRMILAVRQIASPATTEVMQVATTIANGRVAVPIALLLAYALYRLESGRVAGLYVLACITGELLMLLLKELVRRPRPHGISPKLTDAGFYSFPSGHTMLGVIIFGLAVFLLSDRWHRSTRIAALAAAGAFVVLVGLSRIYLGAHWPSDVIGAALAGFAWSAAAVWALRRRPQSPYSAR